MKIFNKIYNTETVIKVIATPLVLSGLAILVYYIVNVK